jgi:hypothetical protein
MRYASRVLRVSTIAVAAMSSALLFASCGGDGAETIRGASHDASFADARGADGSDANDAM